MTRIARTTTVLLLAAASIWLSPPVRAQSEAKTQAAPVEEQPPADRMLAEAQATLASIEDDAQLESTVKSALKTKYEQAMEVLREAASHATRAKEYRESVAQAPDLTAQLRVELEKLPPVEEARKVTIPDDPDEIQLELAAKRASLVELDERIAEISADVSLGEQRPAEISLRIPEVQRELAEARTELSASSQTTDVDSPLRAAEKFALRANELSLTSEVDMLRQEQLSYSVRRKLQQAQRALLTRKAENVKATVAVYEAKLNRSTTQRARAIGAQAEQLKASLAQDDEQATTLAAEVESLTRQLEGIPKDRRRISAAKADVSGKLQRLNSRYDSIKRQLELGRPGVEMAQVLIELRALLNSQARTILQANRSPTLGRMRLDAVQVDIKLENQIDLQEDLAEGTPPAVKELLSLRGELLDILQRQYVELIPLLASLESETRLYLDQAAKLRKDIRQQLYWIQISPTLSASTFRELPAGLHWAFGRPHRLEIERTLKDAIGHTPVRSVLMVSIVALLLIMRGRIVTALRRTAEGVGRVSTDHFGRTGQAVAWTLLLALPVPLLLGSIAVLLAQAESPSAWLRDINHGIPVALLIISFAFFIAACCCPGGLGAAHFGWRPESLSWLRRVSYWFALVYTPLILLANSTLSSESGRFFHSVGRVSFLVINAWLLSLLVRMFSYMRRLSSQFAEENLHTTLARSQQLWSWLFFIIPISLMGLAAFGYTLCGIDLSVILVLSLIIVVSGGVLYALVLRWFKIKHRRLALAEAIERRRARQEAAQQEPEAESGEGVAVVDEDELELDLDSVGAQTRDMLRMLFGLGVVAAVLALWSTTRPLIPFLDTIIIPTTTEFSLMELLKAALVVAVTWLVARNLPGLLELAVLRATSMDTGTRYALTTVCQYAVVLLGAVSLFNILELDWTSFGWIAGGLSVGIGFGMQEVIANFVCGLILLFERPIRVGDVVTVEGTTGTVTKIHMRSTTIINWDYQEFVVPNKTLITNTLLNWTLSAPTNRVVIPVGVAYGTDTDQARQIMLEVAAAHPRILDEPAPLATFEQFDDSALTLLLRASIPNMEKRLATISELHTEIDKRFAAAGIEIAFPQRDIHIRSRPVESPAP
ncbi:MAG: mechanosensitive ion channel domain-containing protein [Planctomycetota bacterium]